MNICGGAVEQQVHEPPIVSMSRSEHRRHSHHSSIEESRSGASSGQQYHHTVDLPVHPSCVVTSSQPQNNNKKTGSSGNSKKKKGDTTDTKTPPRSRSRSRSRSRGRRRSSTTAASATTGSGTTTASSTNNSIEDGIGGMEITTPQRPMTNLSAKGSPSPRMLNPLTSPQRVAVAAAAVANAAAAAGGSVENDSTAAAAAAALAVFPSFSNMKTLDTLLKRLENGFRVTIHNGSDPAGKRVFLTLLQNRTSLMIRPIEGEEGSTPSVKFPVKTILRLEVGKTKSSVLGRPIYDHVHPMTCFSIVVKLWTDAETYFDFEASSVIEREALISTLMVVLDQMHNNNNNNGNSNNTHPNLSLPSPVATAHSPVSSSCGPAWLHPRKVVCSPGAASDHTGFYSAATNETSTPKNPDICLSPGKRTKIYSSNFFEDNGEDQEGTEISLAYDEEPFGPLRSPKSSNRHGNNNNNTTKPLRQRQLQPEAGDTIDSPANPTSPPRTSRYRQSSREFISGITTKQISSSKTPGSPNKSPRVVGGRDRSNKKDEQRDNSEDGGVVILSSNHPSQPETEIQIGPGSADQGDKLQADLSFEIAAQGGLPVSQINLSPTRDNMEERGCCSLAPPNVNGPCGGGGGGNGGNSGQAAWCSDDICTLALKDIADTCTGIFDHHPDYIAKDPSQSVDIGTGEDSEKAAAERAYVEEYIAGVLGGPNSALGSFFPDGDVWNVDSSKPGNQRLKPNRIKNRASLLNAQAIRLRTLRNEMTFAAALKRSREKMQYVQTTKSFDDADGERIREAQERSVSRLHTSALMERMMGSMVLSKAEAEEDAFYYDSDPEDVRPRTKGGVRRALANRRNAVDKDEEQKHQARPVLSGVGFERIAVGKKLRKLDEGLIVQIVQAMRNETLTLMWHPTQSEEYPNRSPVCVNLWIESGVYLVDGSFLLPRLSWSVAYENDLGSKKLNVSKAEPDQIDLLDVCRIRVTEKIDRKLHPFPDPRKSFVIETQDEIYCFEAQTADERNRIVYGYKLVIARLASLLMLRDSRAVEEFFGSASAMVPGGFTVGK